MEHRVVRDLADLPSYAFGPRMTMWWGTLAFCVLEGTASRSLSAAIFISLSSIRTGPSVRLHRYFGPAFSPF